MDSSLEGNNRQFTNAQVVQEATAFSLEAVSNAIDDAIKWLEKEQHEEGYWVGILESNSCMEAQWVLAMHFLGIKDDPKMPGIIKAILREQRPDGSWEVYHEAPDGDINTTVECYAALRSVGF